jgi:hypothetical protein
MALYNRIRFNESQFDGFHISDSFTMSDAITKSVEKTVSDISVVSDGLTKQITSKVLTDTLRINEWVSKERNPAQENWTD